MYARADLVDLEDEEEESLRVRVLPVVEEGGRRVDFFDEEVDLSINLSSTFCKKSSFNQKSK